MNTRIHQTVAGLFAAYSALFTPGAHALDPSQHLTQYAHHTWTVREGFTKGPVLAITQTPDGYLWLGTVFGPVRFDGVRAVPWVPPDGAPLPSPTVVSLLTGHDGTLWIGTLRGLVGWKSGRTTEYPQLAGLDVYVLTEGPNGTVWAAGYSFDSNGKLCSIRPKRVHCDADVRLGHGAVGLHVDRRGTLWVATDGGFWRWAPGTPQFYPAPIQGFSHQDFAEDGSGTLLIPVLGHVARLNAGVIETAYSFPSRMRDARGSRILRDRDGADWIGTDSHGLIRAYGDTRETLTSADGLTSDAILAIFEDREGNIWVTTDKGVDRFSASSVATFSEREGLASPLYSLVAARDGSIWTSNGIPARLYRIQNGQVTLYGAPNAPSDPISRTAGAPGEVAIRDLPHNGIASLFQDALGRIWVVGSDSTGYVEGRRFVSIPDIPRGPAYAVAAAPAGDVWLSNELHGLVHLFHERVQQVIPWPALGNNGLATALAIDPKDETLWIGFSKGGITALRRGHIWKSFTAPDGLGYGRVSHLRFDDDGALWVATDSGLGRLKDGHFDAITTNDGLPCNRLFWSVRGDDRSLWLYGECGLIHIDSRELEAWFARKTSKIRSTLLDASDGVSLFSSDLSQTISPAVALAPDGSIWFRTLDGLSVIRPHHLAVNPVAPPVHIERLSADDVVYDLSGPVRLPAEIRDLAINYTALSFVAPEKMHFRYRLQGQDSHWREAVNDREVQYSNLAPGNYRFQVLASNNSGVWNERGTTLDFSIAPAYWQTNWFRAPCAAAFLLLLWVIYWLRLRRVTHTFNMTLEARVNERTRIARELHDTLLQSFQGLLLHFHAVHQLLPERPAQAKEDIGIAIERTARAISEGRGAVLGLRVKGVEGRDLPAAIRALAEELTSERPVDDVVVHVDVQGMSQPLRPIVHDEIYQIGGEALRNALRHAHASKAEVLLCYGKRQLELRVRDNGRGIDATSLSDDGMAGHFGLHGMRERAELIGGRLTIWTAAASGTEIELTVPAARAYAAGSSGRFAWLRR